MTEKNPLTTGELIKKLSQCDPNTPVRTLHCYRGWSDEEVNIIDIDDQGDVCLLMLSEPFEEEENDW
jgi:hypothetical protein